MGGLLDKANEYSDSVHQGDNVDQKVVNEPSAIIDAYEKGKQAGNKESKGSEPAEAIEATLEPETFTGFEESKVPDEDSRRNLMFQISGSIVFLVVLVSIFYFKYVNWLLVGFAILGSWALFNSEMWITRNIKTSKLIATGAAWLVLSAAVTGGTYTLGGSDVTITSIEFNEKNDEIRITMFGNSGSDIDVRVEMDGQLMCEDSTSISFDQITLSLDVKDCWNGNSLDETGNEVIDYVVVATSGDTTDSYGIPSHIMTREANAGLVKVVEKTTSVQGTSNNYNEYDGIQVDLAIGLDDMSHTYSFADGQFTGIDPWWINADWTATIQVFYESSSVSVYDFNSINADGGVASGYGDFNAAWVTIPSNAGGILKDTDFYDEDGCYTFVVTIENEISGQKVDDRTSLEFWWDQNESDEDTGNDQSAASC